MRRAKLRPTSAELTTHTPHSPTSHYPLGGNFLPFTALSRVLIFEQSLEQNTNFQLMISRRSTGPLEVVHFPRGNGSSKRIARPRKRPIGSNTAAPSPASSRVAAGGPTRRRHADGRAGTREGSFSRFYYPETPCRIKIHLCRIHYPPLVPN